MFAPYKYKALNILVLAVIVYFVNIRISRVSAAETEEGAIDKKTILRDPFISIIDVKKLEYKPDKARAVKMPSFPMTLKGIMVNKDNSVAIINQDIVREGQVWRGFKVESIDNQGVTLSFQNEILRLRMEQAADEGAELSRARDDLARGKDFFPVEEVMIGTSRGR